MLSAFRTTTRRFWSAAASRRLKTPTACCRPPRQAAAVKAVPRHRTPKSFKQSRRVVPQHLLLQELAEAQGAECVDILAEGGDARRWPVRPPQDLLGDFREARKVSRQRLRRNAGDVQVH